MGLCWDDIRVALAVARRGSTLAAARELAISQSTVARRIDHLEAALAARLFVRSQGGYRLTTGGAKALGALETVESAIEDLTGLFPARRRQAANRLRLSAPPLLARYVLAPMLDDLRLRHPDLRWDLVVTESCVDIAGGEADLAFQIGPAPTDPNLIIRRLPTEVNWAVFCSEAYARAYGAPDGPEVLQGHQLLAPASLIETTPTLRWFAHFAGEATEPDCAELSDLIALVAAGEGVSVLPRFVDRERGLVVCHPAPRGVFAAHLWVVYHAARKRDAHLRAVVDGVVEKLEIQRSSARPRTDRYLAPAQTPR